MRQIVLDTETTGIDYKLGHRIIEIGCIELYNRKITNKYFHVYLNPNRKVDKEAFYIHGINYEFLKDKPIFKDIADKFIEFIKGSELIIHNAIFDVSFLDHEFKIINHSLRIKNYCSIFDTLEFAKKKHPGQRNNLDALCKRYGINNSKRTLHNALLDAKILASVYLSMTSGQISLFQNNNRNTYNVHYKNNEIFLYKQIGDIPIILANKQELDEHEKFVQFLYKHSKINLWKD